MAFLLACYTKHPLHEDELLSHASELPTPEVRIGQAEPAFGQEQASSEPVKECQLALDLALEHDESHPITDDEEIYEILIAFGALEKCLYAGREGWLYSYDLTDGSRDNWGMLAHLTEDGQAMDMRFYLKPENGIWKAKDFYDGRQVANQSCKVSLGPQIEFLNRNCKPSEIYHLLTGDNVVDGYVEGQKYYLIRKKEMPYLAGNQESYFLEQDGKTYFVLRYLFTNSGTGFMFDPLTNEQVLIVAGFRLHFIDVETGVEVKVYEEQLLENGREIKVTRERHLDFYEDLPTEFQNLLDELPQGK